MIAAISLGWGIALVVTVLLLVGSVTVNVCLYLHIGEQNAEISVLRRRVAVSELTVLGMVGITVAAVRSSARSRVFGRKVVEVDAVQ